MNTTATTPRTITHAIVSPLVTFEVKNGRTLGRMAHGSDIRTTATEIREYSTYGLFRDAFPRRFALIGTRYVELCKRCDGTGDYPSIEWNGVCFACAGSGRSDKWFADASELDARMTAWGRGVRTTSNKAEATYNARQAEIAAWRTEHADMITWVQALIPSDTDTIDGWHYGHPAGTVLTVEHFNQFGHTASEMISSVREGGDLDRRETAYLTKVMASAIERAANDTSRFAGEVKGKITVTGTVTQIREVEGDYGFSTLIVVSGTGDDDGIMVKTFTTSRATLDMELSTGDAVTVTATVKKHDTYQDIRQTVVTRAKFTRV